MYTFSRFLIPLATIMLLSACDSSNTGPNVLAGNNNSTSNNVVSEEQNILDEPTAAASLTAVDPIATGDRKAEALKLIKDAGHSCDAVVSASALADSTMAVCSDGERYRISRVTVDGQTATLAMKCSAAEQLGVSGC